MLIDLEELNLSFTIPRNVYLTTRLFLYQMPHDIMPPRDDIKSNIILSEHGLELSWETEHDSISIVIDDNISYAYEINKELKHGITTDFNELYGYIRTIKNNSKNT